MTEVVLAASGDHAEPVPAALGQWPELVGRWLDNRRLSDQTRRAYRRDVNAWLDWLGQAGIDPRAVRFTHANAYGRELEAAGRLAPASVARRMSAVASFHDYLRKLGLVAGNPVADADRPKPDRQGPATVGLTVSEALAVIEAADADHGIAALRTAALVRLMVTTGARVAELAGADIGDLRHAEGHRVLDLLGKGNKRREVVVPPLATAALDRYLASRQDRGDQGAPLLRTANGGRITQQYVHQLVRRLARAAGLPAAERVHPHSLRHAAATIARSAGVPVDDIQDQLGHADARTTRGYIHASARREQAPAYAVATALAAAASHPLAYTGAYAQPY